ncbi:MAG: hypothetical protein JSS34_02665 [Proteobacteria bacterium]|nr:hypothetical protein [Pseudomonadota bacterium]
MKKQRTRCLLGVLLSTALSLSSVTFAHQFAQFVCHSHNITSINPQITDRECYELFAETEFYNIKNDVPQFEDTLHQKNKTYKRLSTTFLDQNQQLFLGQAEFDLIREEESYRVKKDMYFLLDLEKHMIRGGWIVPGYCKGNLIGNDQHIHYWPRS